MAESGAMSDQTKNQTYRIVTPEQLAQGYTTCGNLLADPAGSIIHHNYREVRKLPDGNFVVEEPSVQLFDEMLY